MSFQITALQSGVRVRTIPAMADLFPLNFATLLYSSKFAHGGLA